MAKPLNLFDFSDYRKYLSAWLLEAKAQKTSSLSKLAEVAQVHATFLSHVLNGTKQLSLEQAALISEFISHTQFEREYFFILIHIDRAGNKKLKDYWLEKKIILEKEKNKLSHRIDKHKVLNLEQRATYYSSWIYAAIWVSTSCEGAQTLTKIKERFNIPQKQIEDALHFLVESGLCIEEKGNYKMGEVHVHEPNESPFVVKHHMNWRMRAIQKMDLRESNELFFTAPMSLSQEDFLSIREKLNLVIKDIITQAKDSPAEDVFCFNIDFFCTKN